MASDILNGLSTNELHREIQKIVCEDQRSLPQRAKIFAAVAKIQKFDRLPEVVDVAELNAAVAAQSQELNRGLSSSNGMPSHLYARELVLGAMYPGTLSALGNGIYFAGPSVVNADYAPMFPMVSQIALKYTKGESSGCLIRAAIKSTSRIVDFDELRQDFRENRNRARAAGITDAGTFAASLGLDGYYADDIYDDTGERVYTILNRGCLLVQRQCKLVKSP